MFLRENPSIELQVNYTLLFFTLCDNLYSHCLDKINHKIYASSSLFFSQQDNISMSTREGGFKGLKTSFLCYVDLL